MSQASLGELLAHTQSEDAARTRAAQIRAAEQASADGREKFEAVERFFDKAKRLFEEAILTQAAPSALQLQVGNGGRYSTPPATGTHAEIFQYIEGYNTTDHLPRAFGPTGKYVSLWADFQAWAVQQGLQASFKSQEDGFGECSWWVLSVKVNAATTSRVVLKEQPAERERRILLATLKAYVAAGDVLKGLSLDARAQAHLRRHGATLEEAKQLLSELPK